MELLTDQGLLFEIEFKAVSPGLTRIHFRRETYASPFALTSADIYGSETLKVSNGGVQELRHAVVMVPDDYLDVNFFDTFETEDSRRWLFASYT